MANNGNGDLNSILGDANHPRTGDVRRENRMHAVESDAVCRTSLAVVLAFMALVLSAPVRGACKPGEDEYICVMHGIAEIMPHGEIVPHGRIIPAKVPNALQGFSQNRDNPVQIDAATREVRDEDKVATFLGNVRLVQGDTVMRCKSLLVFYDQDAMPSSLTAAKTGPGGLQKIKRLEATGGVIVTHRNQSATGDKAVFDMKANTVTLIGRVVVTQAQNVQRGDKLVTDLTAGVTR
jgi:lipopolysaccharide transport protein LptA